MPDLEEMTCKDASQDKGDKFRWVEISYRTDCPGMLIPERRSGGGLGQPILDKRNLRVCSRCGRYAEVTNERANVSVRPLQLPGVQVGSGKTEA